VHTTEIDRWIAAHHYLQSTPAGAVLRMEFVDDEGRRIGAMMWGRPTSHKLDQEQLLQLTRMYFVDDTEPYTESKALAMARKYIRKHLPQIKGLISYASIDQGHEGTIYKADNWFLIAKRKSGGSWENRPGRTNRDIGPKLKYGRSP